MGKWVKRVLSVVLVLVMSGIAAPVGRLAAGAAFTTKPMISAGGNHTIALKSDGTVWAWGWNCFYVLGIGTAPSQSTPVQIPTLTNMIAIAAQSDHSVALKSDGTVWAWGFNGNGQLGDGTTIGQPTPVQVLSLSSVTAIAAGQAHSVALKDDGTVWTWGYNGYGQLGDGTLTQRETPVKVSISNVTAISANGWNTIALKDNGTVWAWGNNGDGQLGDGTRTQRQTPVQVLGLSDVTAVASGGGHSVALKRDGSVWTWGAYSSGQLGNGTTSYIGLSPIQVPSISNVIAIAARESRTFALKSDGTVWGWGDNNRGQLGDGTISIDRTTPVQMKGPNGEGALNNVAAISVGGDYSVALKRDGSVWTCGENMEGALGDGTTTNRNQLTPVQVLGSGGVGYLNLGKTGGGGAPDPNTQVHLYASVPTLCVGVGETINFDLLIKDGNATIPSKSGFSSVIYNNTVLNGGFKEKTAENDYIFQFTGKKPGESVVRFVETDLGYEQELTVFVVGLHQPCHELPLTGRYPGDILFDNLYCANDGHTLGGVFYNLSNRYAAIDVYDADGNYFAGQMIAPFGIASGNIIDFVGEGLHIINGYGNFFSGLLSGEGLFDSAFEALKGEGFSKSTLVTIADIPDYSTAIITANPNESPSVWLGNSIRAVLGFKSLSA